MTKRYPMIMLLALLFQFSTAQYKVFKNPDSLKGKSFDYLNHNVTANVHDSIRSAIYLYSWLSKAKTEQNYRQMTLAYKTFAYKSDKNLHLKYADSMLIAAEYTHDDLLIGSAYLTKGIIYYDQKEHIKALDNYLLADEYISQTNDSDAAYMLKYTIALTKYYLGFYDEAILLFKECFDYYKEENDRAYLNTIHSLGLCYNKIQRFDLCSSTNGLGLKTSQELENNKMVPYFIHSEGINEYFLKNYRSAIDKLQASLPEIKKNKDFANETVAWFYLGKCYWDLNQPEKALPYFKKVDQIFLTQNYIRPDLRENYELLIDYYKKKNDQPTQLLYINTLLKVDKLLNINYKYLSGKIFKEYDTKKLLLAKFEIEQSLRRKNAIGLVIIIALVVLIAFLVYQHRKIRQKYRQRFEELMNRKEQPHKPVSTAIKTGNSDISPEVKATIMKNMERFEQKKEYLQKDMTQVKLATLLNTNTRYVAKIVMLATGKNTIDYLCDLKVDYIVELLKTDSRARNYTNKALGEEAGFGCTQNFTRAFKSRNGISPTYFIEELKKSLAEKNLQ